MGIGLPLLEVLTVDQLPGGDRARARPLRGGDTRVSALVHRAGATVARTSEHLGPQTWLGRLFAAYARLYARVSLRVRRRQELRADAGSVRVVGRDTHVQGPRRGPHRRCCVGLLRLPLRVPLWQAGAAPQDLYAGFRACSRSRRASPSSTRSGAQPARTSTTTRTTRTPRWLLG
jgi:hypothetical protein